MPLARVLLGTVLALVAAGPVSFGQETPAEPPNDLVVHEWGTFLAMQGSDGVSLDGMYHEEHALPAFVHARSRDQLRLPSVSLKGETPVIYFYTERAQRVWVNVGFPHGIWTQWYPQARMVRPSLAAPGLPPQLRNGSITWSADLVPSKPGQPAPALPATSADALWNFARDVDAAYVRVAPRGGKPEQAELERFIFYRGLGQAQLPIQLDPADDGTLRSLGSDDMALLHIFVLRVENGRGAYRHVPVLHRGESQAHVIPDLSRSLPLDEFADKIAVELASRLAGSGLYPKEARAMVNTWRRSYFETDGVRVLFVLPQKWTDEFIPMSVSPPPKQITRVMVGRIELLTPERERLAESAVRGLGSPDADARDVAFAYLRGQGRYVEPILRRVLRTTKDGSVRTLCKRLLLTDFVTELRSAVYLANGERAWENPVFVRARLASLLREIGLDDEAKAEAKTVLAALEKMKLPPMSNESARHHLRAYARAMEAVGDEPAATEAYAKFVRFGSQVRSREQCIGCHQGNEGPQDTTWFRSWWAGQRFAQHAVRSGVADKLIAENESVLKQERDRAAAELLLAYLYAAKGRSRDADRMWTKIAPPKGSPEPLAAIETSQQPAGRAVDSPQPGRRESMR